MPKNAYSIEYIIKEPDKDRGSVLKMGQTSGSWEGNELENISGLWERLAPDVIGESVFYLRDAALQL